MQEQHSIRITRYLGVDFGACTTVIASRSRDNGDVVPVDFPGWSHPLPSGPGAPGIPVVPSQVRYDEAGTCFIGADTGDLPGTARWLVPYICTDNPARIPAGHARMIGYKNAGSDFLTDLLTRAATGYITGTGLVISVPHNAPAHYTGWLRDVAASAGFPQCRTLEAPLAAIHGYGIPAENVQPRIVIAFDRTGLEITVVECRDATYQISGRATCDTGCSRIDSWIAEDLLDRNRLYPAPPPISPAFPGLVEESAKARQRLVVAGDTRIDVPVRLASLLRETRLDRAGLARIGTEHAVPDAIRHTINLTRADAGLTGTARKPGTVLLIGEYCTMPWVAEIISRHCPGIPVRRDHPLDAVARGAALYEPVAAARNRIANDYVLRYRDPVTGGHQYRFLARSGTRFPSAGQVARVVISATYDGQCQLGLPLCEIPPLGDAQPGGGFELVAGSDGGLHVIPPSPDAGEGSRPVPVIPDNPVFLSAIPPAKKGEPRFELTFRLDREGWLCVTARDLVSGKLVKENEAVHRLR